MELSGCTNTVATFTNESQLLNLWKSVFHCFVPFPNELRRCSGHLRNQVVESKKRSNEPMSLAPVCRSCNTRPGYPETDAKGLG